MKTKTKKLSLQYGYLSLEKKEVFEACFSVEKEMRKYMKEHYPDETEEFFNNAKKNVVEEEEPKKDNKPKHKDVKKIYRKLASKIHPDLTDNEEEKLLFAEAAEAYRESDLGKLLEIASVVRIDIPNLSDECLFILQDNIQELIKKIDNKKTTSSWAWYGAKNHEDKMIILEKIIQTIRSQR